jgi:hypothetical protein
MTNKATPIMATYSTYSTSSLRIDAMDLATCVEYNPERYIGIADMQRRNYERFVNMRTVLIELARSVSSDDILHDIEKSNDCSGFDDYLEILLDRVQDFQLNPAEINVILDRILVVSQL